MKRRVRKFLAHFYRKKGVMRESWDMLPPRLRRDLLGFEHKEFFERFARLRGADPVGQYDELVHRLAVQPRVSPRVFGIGYWVLLCVAINERSKKKPPAGHHTSYDDNQHRNYLFFIFSTIS